MLYNRHIQKIEIGALNAQIKGKMEQQTRWQTQGYAENSGA